MRLFRTLRYLHARQIVFQVVSRLRPRARLQMPTMSVTSHFLAAPEPTKPVSYQNGTFTFLNVAVAFSGRINWNYAEQGKLWTYNLNYFDFLNQPDLPVGTGLALMRDFIAQTDHLRDGLEPYPTSLRIINWVQFLSRNQLRDAVINAHLYAQTARLRSRLEYHLEGNHLLENGFALLLGAMYFRHRGWFRRASRLVRAELTIQILADGGHDERSPMYHHILLTRLNDVRLAMRHDTWHSDPALLTFLTEKAKQMQQWLASVTFSNGDWPMVNDCISGNSFRAVPPSVIARRSDVSELSPTTGYRMFRFPRYELLADVGAVGPDHQPGHAHADTFSFVLYVDDKPLLVDSGTSTYQIGPRRDWERSTAAHNTVELIRPDGRGQNSSEVWGGFRVGRRARVQVLTETDGTLAARHDGYRCLSIFHRREWVFELVKIRILDRLLTNLDALAHSQAATARFYVHPDVGVTLADAVVEVGIARLTFGSDVAPVVRLTDYEMANGFSRLRPGRCIEVTFRGWLETVITL